MDRILICVPSYGQNDVRFTATAFLLAKFPGTDFIQTRRSAVDTARNKMAQQGLLGKYDWIFMVDDDMLSEKEHPAATLERLIQILTDRPDAGVAAPRAYKRTKPFYPCLFRSRGPEGYDPVEDINQGLVEVDAIHYAWTLIRPSVFEKVPQPWFEFVMLGGERASEDIAFSRKVQAAGIKMLCDTDTEIQHLSDPTVVDSGVYEACKRASAATKITIPASPKYQIPILKSFAQKGLSGDAKV